MAEKTEAESLRQIGEAAEMVADGMRKAARNVLESSLVLIKKGMRGSAQAEPARNTKEKEQEQ